MLGITFTIQNGNKTREEERKLKDIENATISIPILSFELLEEFTKRPRHYRMKKTTSNLINFSLVSDFYIKNISNYFAMINDFKLISIEIDNLFPEDRVQIKKDNILEYTFENGDLIPPNTILNVNYDINCTLENFNSIIFKMQLIYSDFMNINKYTIDAEFSLFISIIDKETLDNYYSEGEGIHIEDDEFYIEVSYSKFVNKFKKL